jgi:hypothetical protein
MFWILWWILVTQYLSDQRHSLMLPTDENISWPSVTIDDILDTYIIFALDGGVNLKTQVLCNREDCVVRSLLLAILEAFESAVDRFKIRK